MWKKGKHSFRTLIKREERELEREIKRTRYPYFNLYRLATQPCKEFRCCEEHIEKIDKVFVVGIFAFFSLLLLALLLSTDSWFWIGTCYLGELLLVYFAFNFWHVIKWSEHEPKLKEKRDSLQSVSSPGLALTRVLRSDIERCKQNILGDGRPLAQSGVMLENRIQDGAISKRQTVDLAGYRDQALTGVRVALAAQYDEDVPTVHARYLAFKQEAEEAFARFNRQAEALGKSVDNLDQIRGKDHFSKHAETEIRDLENAIQEQVDLLYFGLEVLVEKTEEINAATARATVRHDVSQVNDFNPALDSDEAETSEASGVHVSAAGVGKKVK